MYLITFKGLNCRIERRMLQPYLINVKYAITRYYPPIHLSNAARHQASDHDHRLRHVQGVLVVQDGEAQPLLPLDQDDLLHVGLPHGDVGGVEVVEAMG